MRNKKAFQISFAWLFAIIVGAFILFLAIYGVTKIMKTGSDFTSARTGAEIGVLLNPLETGFESGRTSLLTMPVDTQIHNRCTETGTFGKQIIKISQKNFGKWSATDVDVGFANKYIFSDANVEGRNFLIFSKPFEFPFKIADLIYLTSSKNSYCLVNAPSRIEDEISDLGQENLYLENCPANSINVCFGIYSGTVECDIYVNENRKSVEKEGEIVYYETDALMYAAIFSDVDVYECQIKRLLQRLNELLTIYEDKNAIISLRGCSADVDLFTLKSEIDRFGNSEDLMNVASIAEHINRQNNLENCKLW
ncbi:hypothetical protein FJZ20_00975 [Candidatus Pacearchaeota archaeon]|nr:hypothetical protein [Candidatus Pacearchaeota archaeon]